MSNAQQTKGLSLHYYYRITTLKNTGNLQEVHYKTAKIAAITTFVGTVFITISTPVLSYHIRQRLFDPRLIYIFILIPSLAIAVYALFYRFGIVDFSRYYSPVSDNLSSGGYP